MKQLLIIVLLSTYGYGQDFYRSEEDIRTLLPTANDSLKTLLYSDLFNKNRNKDLKLARHFLDTMRIFAEKAKHKDLMGITLRNEGTYFSRKSDYYKSKDSILKSIALFKETKNDSELSHSYNNLGITYRHLGKLDSAMYYNMKSLRIKEQLHEAPEKLGLSYSTIGVIHGMLNNFDQAEAYFKKAEKIYLEKNNERLLGSIWSKMGVNNKNRGDFEKSIFYYKKSDSIYKKTNNLIGRSVTLLNIGVTYLDFKNIDQAQKYNAEAYNLAKKINYKRIIMKALNNLAVIEMEQENYKDAKAHIFESMALTGESKRQEINIFHYDNLAKIHEGLGDYKTAYTYSQKHFMLFDSIFNEEKTMQINELETKYQTEKKETEIKLQKEQIKTLNAREKVTTLKKSLYAGGMVSALALSGLLIFGFRQRMKKNRIAREKQEEIYKQEIEHKKKELASQTLHLVQKNTFLEELKENLENLKNSPEKFKIEFRRIVMLLKKEKASDKDWETFKSYFSEVHNDFDQKLKTFYSNISEKEIRLAAFLRMNLTTKEIAATMNVLPDSILKSKYRLKKKLGLDKEIDLTDFLNSI